MTTYLTVASTLGLVLLSACSGGQAYLAPTATDAFSAPQAAPSSATPEPAPDFTCQPGVEASPAMTEGPYFKAGSPERASLLESGTQGQRLELSGFVLSTTCAPIPGARLEFWQAGANGAYDNAGFALRGHQFTDAAGAYHLTTIIPGEYPGRTEHIHVKVQPPGQAELTTQLFFPDVAGNALDFIFDPRLVIAMQAAADGWAGQFNFIVPSP